jgi:transaldolase
MKLFIDSADVDEIRAAAALGVVDGVTTNPALLARRKVRLLDLLPEICALVDGPVSAPARGVETEALVAEGRLLAKVHDNVVIKIPIHADGLRAMSKLHSEGIRTHATLCCSAGQALLAAKSGADFVSPLVGRLDELGGAGLDLVADIIEIYDNYEFDAQIVVASVRHALHVQESALLGADACTVPWRVLQDLMRHPLADSLHSAYLADWPRS